MTRVIQISDTHLSGEKPHFLPNWAPLRDWIAREAPDLVIHTGDVTVDGTVREPDLAFCADRMTELGPPLLVVPGNHDVGIAGAPGHHPTPERLARWEHYFGPDRWSRDIPGWRLLGLNAMIVGSGEPREAEQHAWLEAEMASAGQRRTAWFMHQPLFLDHPAEPDTGYWAMSPAAREPLLRLIRAHGVALVATGHLHKANDAVLDGTRYVWCPPSSFIIREATQPDMPGTKQLGAVAYEFGDRGVTVSTVVLPELEPYWIDDVANEVYPRPAPDTPAR